MPPTRRWKKNLPDKKVGGFEAKRGAFDNGFY